MKANSVKFFPDLRETRILIKIHGAILNQIEFTQKRNNLSFERENFYQSFLLHASKFDACDGKNIIISRKGGVRYAKEIKLDYASMFKEISCESLCQLQNKDQKELVNFLAAECFKRLKLERDWPTLCF